MSRNTVIVYAPTGTGKHTESLKRAFGLDRVIHAEPGETLPTHGALVITGSPDVHKFEGGDHAAIDVDAALRYAHRHRRQRHH